jgi:uncharacterized RDD family membrane protein YckC
MLYEDTGVPSGQEAVLPRYAGFWIRLVAAVIDMVVLVVIAIAVAFIFALMLVSAGRDLALLIILVMVTVVLIIGWLYNALFESSVYMGTPGKILCGIKVTDIAGNRISFGRATLRYLLKDGIIAILRLINDSFTCIAFIYMVSDIFVLVINDKKQSIHDIVAGTVVIYK